MSLHYSDGEFFILETSFGGGFDYPEFIRKHVALKANADLHIPDLMERYAEWLARTGKPAATVLIEHHFGEGYSDNVDGDGFIAWMASQGKVDILTSKVVKVSVEAYEGGDVRVSADDGVGGGWKQLLDDPAPRVEQIAWREIEERASPADPEALVPFAVANVNINPAVKNALNFDGDLASAVAAQLVRQQFDVRADWRDQELYTVTAVQRDGEEDRSRSIRIEIKEPAAYQGIYTVQMMRYVRKGVESFGFHGRRYQPTSLEANRQSLLVLSGSILPQDVHNVYEIHSAENPLRVYEKEREQFEDLLASVDRQSDIVRSKVTGELGIMVRESLVAYDMEQLFALPSYRKLREEMKVPVHIIENWPVVSGVYVGAFVSAARINDLETVGCAVADIESDMRHRLNVRHP